MSPFTNHSGVAALLDRKNVDTDQIIPKQFLKRVEKTGYGEFLFFDWRFNNDGSPNPDFELNQESFQGASILVTDDNFGCGSSREHAPWALLDYGFKVIIAQSYADIFYNNCFKNGILPISLGSLELLQLKNEIRTNEGVKFEIDLVNQTIKTPAGLSFNFDIEEFRKVRLLKGLDDIALSLQQQSKVIDFEAAQKKEFPWLWKSS